VRSTWTLAALVGATGGAGVLLLVLPGRAALVAHVWLVVVLGIGLGVALERLRHAVPRRPSSFDTAFVRPRVSRARPASLDRVEREITLATGTAFDVHYRLRPLLSPIATDLLLRRGVGLDDERGRAAELLGPDAWELVRPDRPAPADRAARGITLESAGRAVDGLERLAWS
jgi:hypothetical protein